MPWTHLMCAFHASRSRAGPYPCCLQSCSRCKARAQTRVAIWLLKYMPRMSPNQAGMCQKILPLPHLQSSMYPLLSSSMPLSQISLGLSQAVLEHRQPAVYKSSRWKTITKQNSQRNKPRHVSEEALIAMAFAMQV
eukprot:2033341-Pleurochrysis_carterae.AAC.4